MFTSNLSRSKSILNARFNFRFSQRVPKWLFSASREVLAGWLRRQEHAIAPFIIPLLDQHLNREQRYTPPPSHLQFHTASTPTLPTDISSFVKMSFIPPLTDLVTTTTTTT